MEEEKYTKEMMDDVKETMELWGLQEIGMTEQRGKYWVQQKVFAFFK
jgi:hypothetical protein